MAHPTLWIGIESKYFYTEIFKGKERKGRKRKGKERKRNRKERKRNRKERKRKGNKRSKPMQRQYYSNTLPQAGEDTTEKENYMGYRPIFHMNNKSIQNRGAEEREGSAVKNTCCGYKKTGVPFPAPTSSNSQRPGTPAPSSLLDPHTDIRMYT